MAYTNIDKSSDYFNTKLYTGNGSTQSITGVGFQPDWIWFKVRSEIGSHRIVDSVRGNTKYLYANGTDAEATVTTNVTSFDSDGFSLGNGSVNEISRTYASWNWLASNTTASNTDGSITSTVSANTTSGFSIVKYTGTGANATVGHGLGVAPKMVIIKRLETATHWLVGGGNIGWTKNLYLSTTSAEQTYNHFQDQSPSSSVVYMTNDLALNGSSEDYIMYCFAEKKGFSKFGSYTGNGSTDGTFVYTGFKPAFTLIKRTDTTSNWLLFDNKRSPSGGFNEIQYTLYPNLSNAEDQGNTGNDIDFLSNGFKMREDNGDSNGSGGTYIYMAFAEQPLTGTNGVPCTAR